MESSGCLNERAQFDLLERVKELSCLYGIARIAAETNLSIDMVLDGIVEVLPAAWLDPGLACARIVLDGRSYLTSNYTRRVKHRQRAPIVIDGRKRGYVEVAYPEEKPGRDEGPFLKEERALIDTVAREVAVIIMRREAEQDKVKLEEQLRHADRLATIGQLAAGVAHELNEPLGHILGFAQLVQKCPDLPVQAKADVDRILSTSLYAREIVKKLLMFSRQISPQKTKVNLNHLVRNGLNLLEFRCASDGITVHCFLPSDLPEIDADPSQLTQVFVNLIVNAIQAMPAGGTLTIRTLKGRGKVFLTIGDTGVGMDEEALQKIFTPFFTTKDVGLGTGLGLPVAHGIIAAHGGSIKVESKVGKGTTCRIQLPTKRNRPL
ncbi:sensor histidine kinase [Syntrophorhabdus aromaticivorans]|uniref:histidine kinase n=1 Tax=Syntrophorhabdus aromaticivorans TaxID=328301 RepID=A0A971RZL1_9BACT|nr:ATP-binding protein [Syntrophorhabdus aromaticivorans]NLW34066.1 sensor histidine kinase [Syntrophorhabdus aromaticivorans]